MNVWAGGGVEEYPPDTDQEYFEQMEQGSFAIQPELAHTEAHTEVPDTLGHGVFHWVSVNVPGGELTVMGFALLGLGTSIWWKFHKSVEGWIVRIVKRKMEKDGK